MASDKTMDAEVNENGDGNVENSLEGNKFDLIEPKVILENILRNIEQVCPNNRNNSNVRPSLILDQQLLLNQQQQQQQTLDAADYPSILENDPILEIEIDSSSSPPEPSNSSSSSFSSSTNPSSSTATYTNNNGGLLKANKQSSPFNSKKSVLFDTVTIFHFTRSQGFSSIPSQGGSTLGMKRRHFLRRKLSVDLFEEVRRRSRREILLKIKLDKERLRRQKRKRSSVNNCDQNLINAAPIEANPTIANLIKSIPQTNSTQTAQPTDSTQVVSNNLELNSNNGQHQQEQQFLSSSVSTSTKQTESSTFAYFLDVEDDEDDDDDDYKPGGADSSCSDLSDISDSELDGESFVFLQPIGVKLRRSLLRASGVCRIDPVEKKECKKIRDSRERSGCKCVNQCIPGLCECSRLGVNCHVDRVAFPCGCISGGCRNPQGRTEFDIKRVKGHLYEKLFKIGVG